ncbi:hypothetical protein ACFQ69_27075 [Streptomyces sp. NPDC056470]|uniref:hypothetical protein n=1 Tax=Streptomyces sp. NPDC056470 TaxID=3345831 RepID=UPI003679506D
MTDARANEQGLDEGDEQPRMPPPRPPRKVGRGPEDHYGVVRAEPPTDDYEHDEVSPAFDTTAPSPTGQPQATQQSGDSEG